MKPKCACGCGQRAANKHHIVYVQRLRELARRERDKRLRREIEAQLVADKRNLMWLAFDCHGSHHSGARRLPLGRLPDSVFEFALEVLGAGPAHEYLRRRYSGEDARLDALLVEAEAA